MGFGRTRAEARQLVLHRHILVNGKSVNVPSFQVKAGDVLTVRERSQKKVVFVASAEYAGRHETPDWVEVEREKFAGTVKSVPTRDAITMPIREQLIVEFYSR